MSRKRRHELILIVAVLFILWQLWQKVHIVIFVPIPWWGLLLLVLVAIALLDLALDRLLGKD